MIICNGSAKVGTHILTNIAKEVGAKQIVGTLIKRFADTPLRSNSKLSLDEILKYDDSHYMHAHIAFSRDVVEILKKHKVLYIYRNAKDVAVSWMRHKHKQDSNIEISSESLISIIRNGMHGKSIAEFYSHYVCWINHPSCFTIKFEDILNDDYSFMELASFLDVDMALLGRHIFQYSCTKNSKKSDWREYWNNEVQLAWLESGGEKLEQNIIDLGFK